MKISGMDQSKLNILAACEDFLSTKEIAVIVGIHHKTVSQYLSNLGDFVIREIGTRPWRYKRNPEMAFVPGLAERKIQAKFADKTAPILPQGPLSFIRDCERYTPPEGRRVKESHGAWAGRSNGPYMECGSSAYVDMNG
jgi:hypothetical protein